MTSNAQFATLWGIGAVPLAPGTAASLVAALVAWPVIHFAGGPALALLSVAVGLFGVKVSGDYASESGKEDPPDCVIDEVAGQWLACAFAPPSALGFLAAFLLFRLFDMAKPWPVSAAERLDGGWGIVADDMVAGLIAGIVVMLFDAAGFL
ncbi:MAG: phosphatidylglycerophosphatase A [Alphaproteobacteria bacterium]|nr:phosphatidylglycerophosphatase A [Alphaproteobacteria bacterium]